MTRSSPFATAAAAQELLHDPVLKAVESDDRQAAARLQHCFSRLQTAFQLLQFAIEVNADRLKRPRRPVLLVASAIAHGLRSEEHPSELTSLLRHSYAAFCLQMTILLV